MILIPVEEALSRISSAIRDPTKSNMIKRSQICLWWTLSYSVQSRAIELMDQDLQPLSTEICRHGNRVALTSWCWWNSKIGQKYHQTKNVKCCAWDLSLILVPQRQKCCIINRKWRILISSSRSMRNVAMDHNECQFRSHYGSWRRTLCDDNVNIVNR